MQSSGSHEAMATQIRLAFASGEPAAGEELFARALDSGMPWDVATRAAAEGVASHFRVTPRAKGFQGHGTGLNHL